MTALIVASSQITWAASPFIGTWTMKAHECKSGAPAMSYPGVSVTAGYTFTEAEVTMKVDLKIDGQACTSQLVGGYTYDASVITLTTTGVSGTCNSETHPGETTVAPYSLSGNTLKITATKAEGPGGQCPVGDFAVTVLTR